MLNAREEWTQPFAYPSIIVSHGSFAPLHLSIRLCFVAGAVPFFLPHFSMRFQLNRHWVLFYDGNISHPFASSSKPILFVSRSSTRKKNAHKTNKTEPRFCSPLRRRERASYVHYQSANFHAILQSFANWNRLHCILSFFVRFFYLIMISASLVSALRVASVGEQCDSIIHG